MDTLPPSPLLPNKHKHLSKITNMYFQLSVFIKKQKALFVLLAVVILIVCCAVFYVQQKETEPNKITSSKVINKIEQNADNKITKGSLLKIGDYVQFGSYEVEKEGYNPLLWVVIDNNNHYGGNTNPAVSHLTLLTADIIDLRGFDAIEPQNANDIRRGFGNSRYRTSNIRQWLNSNNEANQWWKPQNLEGANNNADAPPANKGFPDYDDLGYDDKDGFLKGFSENEKQAILETNITVVKNTVTEGGGEETVTDEVFLLSLTETGFENLESVAEDKLFSVFNNDLKQAKVSQECAVNSKSSDKPSPDKNWNWWLRSPSTGFPASVYTISSTGSVLYSPADMPEGSIGLRPALNIKKNYIFSGAGTRENPFLVSAESDDFTAEDLETTKNKDAIATVDEKKTNLSESDKTFKDICQSVINDYPEDRMSLGGIVAWEDADETFYIRSSPDNSIWRAENPAKDDYKLINIGFIDGNTIGFTLSNTNQKYKVGIMDIKFTNSGTVFEGNSSHITYENTGDVLDVSYINKEDFVILDREKNKVLLKHKDALLYQADYIDTDSYKLGKSPNGANLYLNIKNNLSIFDIQSDTKIGDVENVSSAVWIGNSNILCSGKDTTFLYNIKTRMSEKNNTIKPGILGFCPKDGGVIMYNTSAEARAISCQTFDELNSTSSIFFETLADSNTAIYTKYKPDDSTKETGYWRFISAGWGLHLSYGMYYHNSKPVLATLWSNY